MPLGDLEYEKLVNDVVEILLSDIALKIQLKPHEHELAVGHYKALEEWLERDSSPLKGAVLRMYPQGSVATGTTISSSNDKEDFDIVVEVDMPPDSNSEEVLDWGLYT